MRRVFSGRSTYYGVLAWSLLAFLHHGFPRNAPVRRATTVVDAGVEPRKTFPSDERVHTPRNRGTTSDILAAAQCVCRITLGGHIRTVKTSISRITGRSVHAQGDHRYSRACYRNCVGIVISLKNYFSSS